MSAYTIVSIIVPAMLLTLICSEMKFHSQHCIYTVFFFLKIIEFVEQIYWWMVHTNTLHIVFQLPRILFNWKDDQTPEGRWDTVNALTLVSLAICLTSEVRSLRTTLLWSKLPWVSILRKAECRLRINKILDLWKLITNNRNNDINEIQVFKPNKHVVH